MRIYLIFSLFVRMVFGLVNYDADFSWKLTPEPPGGWEGNAPTCNAEPEDCPNVGKYFGFRTAGPPEGELCLYGAKTYCTDYDVWTDIKEYGTPPFCDGHCNDCPDGYECIATGRYGDIDAGGFEICRWWFDNTERVAFCGKPVKEYQYYGCYADSQSSPAFDYEVSGSGWTVSGCRLECKQYEFFGIGPGGICSCDDDLDHVVQYGASSNCGSSRNGGASAKSVFRNYYRGCWQDDANNPALNQQQISLISFYNLITTSVDEDHAAAWMLEACRDSCIGYYYFAIRNNYICSCGSDFGRAVSYGESSDCSSRGTGGEMSISLYENYHCSQVSGGYTYWFFCLLSMTYVYQQKHQSSAANVDNTFKIINNENITTDHKIMHWLLFIIIVAIFINIVCVCWYLCRYQKSKQKPIQTYAFDQESDTESDTEC